MAKKEKGEGESPTPITKGDALSAQTSYKGNSQHEKVHVVITKGNGHYKEGDEDDVHPTTAAILKAKGMIMLIGFMLCFAFASKAQVALSQTTFNSTGAITNTSKDTMTATLTNLVYYTYVGVQPVVTKASGTMAGTAILYGSIDGTNFVSLGDTMTLANQTTNTTIWTITAPVYKKYMIVVGGATTVTATCTAKIILLKP